MKTLKLVEIKFEYYGSPHYMISTDENYYINNGRDYGEEESRKVIAELEPTLINKLSLVCFVYYQRVNFTSLHREHYDFHIRCLRMVTQNPKPQFEIEEVDRIWDESSKYIELESWSDISDFKKSFAKFEKLLTGLMANTEKQIKELHQKIETGRDFLSKIETLSKQ